VARSDAGVSRALARERARRVTNIRYRIELDIPDDRREPIGGHLVLSFDLDDVRGPLILNFAPGATGGLTRCACNGCGLTTAVFDGHLVLPASALAERNHVALDFLAGDGPLNRRDGYLYTLFVPARCHEAFPCFDQPDLKARFTLQLTIPGGWTAVSNAAEASSTERPGHRRTVQFTETEPIPTYLFAFAAGSFRAETSSTSKNHIRLFHVDDDELRVRQNTPAIIEAHEHALAWMTDYTAVPYPFGKLDVVLIEAFQFGGMEHPGAIVYNAGSLLLDRSATGHQLFARAHVIAHETAHMWFGDLVTMTWFDDVWMKEVFANLMAAKIVNPLFPGLDHDLRFFHSHYAGAYDVDRTAGTNAVRQRLDNLLDAASLYGPIVYLKSPIVMRQLELVLGERTFRDILREYLDRHRFGNAAWTDLVDLIVARAPFDVRAWSAAWIDEPGRPFIRTDLRLAGPAQGRDARIEELVLDQHDPQPSRNLLWPQRLVVTLGYQQDLVHVEETLDEHQARADAARGHRAPLFVLPNGRGVGYGRFALSDSSREWLVANLPAVDDPMTRAAAWLSLWDGMLEGEVGAACLLDLAVRLIASEPNEMNLQHVLTCAQRLFWVVVTPDVRAQYAGLLERALCDLVDARDDTAKGALFACLRHVATTEGTRHWLHALWSGDAIITGLPLSEADRIALALELAVRGDRSIVREQIGRTRSPEHLARLVFLAPAVSTDAGERAAFLDELRDEQNRRREPWVVEGLSWLHHPLLAPASVPLVTSGLHLLEDVKRGGDIFLPKRWTDATLAGHRSPEAAAAVRTFMRDLTPTYPEALRRVILIAADPLFRLVDGVITP
jgi:aminopeptidase N